jgi:hypothetical protein
MPNVADYFASESQWLKAADHEDMNRRVKVEKVGSDVLTGDDGEKDVIWVKFDKAPKPIILSKTNGMAMIAAYGEESDAWYGKEVQLTTKKYNINGNNTTGWICVPLKDSDPEDDIPF